jgi:hypothetical protein
MTNHKHAGRLKGRGWNRIRSFVPRLRVAVANLRKRRMHTLAERLGYGPHARLLIVHADDLGLADSVNNAFFSGLATGLINSGSVMVPCPCFSGVAAFAQSHLDADIGLHLTLTSERAKSWAPVAPSTQVSSLVDQRGCLHEKWPPEIRISLGEVEIELRAQIEKAYAAGLRPTHLDSHQFLLQMKGPGFFDVYIGLGREYRLPVLVTRQWFAKFAYLQPLLRPRDVVLDRAITITPKVSPEQWPAYYKQALEKLPAGVTELLIHPAYDDEELRSVFEERQPWGAAWRQRDFDFFTSSEFRAVLDKEDIKLITWREIATKLQ